MAGCVSSQCSGKAFCLHVVCHQGGDFLDCPVGGLRLGSATAGVQLRREGVSALPRQLCGDGFSSDPAAQASLGRLTPLPKLEDYGYSSALSEGVCRLKIRAALQRLKRTSVSGRQCRYGRYPLGQG